MARRRLSKAEQVKLLREFYEKHPDVKRSTDEVLAKMGVVDNYDQYGNIVTATGAEASMFEEGDACPCPGCNGEMIVEQNPCTCHASPMPPCPACEGSWLECSDCNWREGDPVDDFTQRERPDPPPCEHDPYAKIEGSW